MFRFQNTDLEILEKINKKFFTKKVWKKFFFSCSFSKILKVIFNYSITNYSTSLYNNNDIKLYMLFIKLTTFNNSSIIFGLSRLQDASLFLRITGFLFQNYLKKFKIYYVEYFRAKNDLRLNKNFKSLLEKKNISRNRILNSIFNFFDLNFIATNSQILKKNLKRQVCSPTYFFKIKILSKAKPISFRIF